MQSGWDGHGAFVDIQRSAARTSVTPVKQDVRVEAGAIASVAGAT